MIRVSRRLVYRPEGSSMWLADLLAHGLIRGSFVPPSEQTLVQLKRRGIRATKEQLLDALQGRLQEHHRVVLQIHLDQIDSIEQAMTELEARMEGLLEPFRDQVDLVKTLPGIQETTARIVLAEIGFVPTRF